MISILVLLTGCMVPAAGAEKGSMAMNSLRGAQMQFGGVAGERIAANVDGWLLRAARSNPGMLEMFRLRDRLPSPHLVPWAGEFAGKLLLSCTGTLGVTNRPDLRNHTAEFVRELIATQAGDGYLGPFPQSRRLLGEWDLWGHYHIMQGLLAWYDLTGEAEAIECVERAAGLICGTYLDGDRRVIDAGSDEMNMAVSHVMAELHRRTGNPRYLELVRQIESDWERAGDYLRTGLAKVPFFRTPRPRWESLHGLQTLVELWRITGNADYRDAFESHWRTILDYDVRNSGAFSGGEQATGNPWAPTAIETCCTVAWMAVTIDFLALSGSERAAAELERSTFNGAFGAQHPAGHWWTYNTPMDGDRKASAHDIVFQARPGTPELNCCSVNGPRTPGMLARWAVMAAGEDLVVQTHAPMTLTTSGSGVRMTCESRYPVDGDVSWRIVSSGRQPVRFRIPAWAEGATGSLNGTELDLTPGTYIRIDRAWRDGDVVHFRFPMRLRILSGEREQSGKVSVFRGPLLMAWDQCDNRYDEPEIPLLSPAMLDAAAAVALPPGGLRACPPWVLMEIPGGARPVRLRDFATAGMNGTRYRSWLRAAGRTGSFGPADVTSAADVIVTGPDDIHRVPLPEAWAGGDYSVEVKVTISRLPAGRIGQVFSAWCAPGDDPVRIFVAEGSLHAAIEGAGGARTQGVPVSAGTPYHLTAVKDGTILTLYLNGRPVAGCTAPAALRSQSKLGAAGGNPLFTGGPEDLPATFHGLSVWRRALTASEVAERAGKSR